LQNGKEEEGGKIVGNVKVPVFCCRRKLRRRRRR